MVVFVFVWWVVVLSQYDDLVFVIVMWYVCVVVVVFVRQVVVSSQYDDLVFVVVVRRLFMFELFKRVKYIQSETRNQINGRQYATELPSIMNQIF